MIHSLPYWRSLGFLYLPNMAWTCTYCGKSFAKENQSHKCEKVSVEELFENRAAHLPDLFEGLKGILEQIGGFRVTTSKKAITLYAPSHKAFLGIELKKKFLDIWFILEEERDEFPVFKVVKPSKYRFAHYVRLAQEEDLDVLPVHLIKEAYERVC